MHIEHDKSDLLGDDLQLLTEDIAERPQLLIDVLNAIFDRVFIKDRECKVMFANRAFLRDFGLRPSEVIGRDLHEFLPEDMVAKCQAADRAVLESGEATCLETSWSDSVSGQRRYTETHKAPLRDAHGTITGIVGISRDITSRRKTEEELERQKTLLELIVETVPDWIFVKDRDRRLLLANHSFYADHQLDPGETTGEDPTAHLTKSIRKTSHDTDKYVLESGQPTTGNLSLVDPAGRERFIEFRKMPLVVEGETTGIVSVCRDLTDWKKAEEQSKRNESLLLHAARLSSLGELSAGIAHEVNQPLYSILNYAKAIKNKLQDEDSLDLEAIRNWVDQIHSEAARGGEITLRLKSFVKPTETQRQLSSIDQTIEESIQFVRIEARDAGAVIENSFASDVPPLVFDRIQIQQVLINLLKNAIEACVEAATQSPRIDVATAIDDGFVVVSVADNGPGVSVTDEMNILDPFHTTKHDGMGLGLAISKTIVEAHDGQLSYHTNEIEGTTFRFSLPIENSNPSAETRVEST